jgi:hypothetical protein
MWHSRNHYIENDTFGEMIRHPTPERILWLEVLTRAYLDMLGYLEDTFDNGERRKDAIQARAWVLSRDDFTVEQSFAWCVVNVFDTEFQSTVELHIKRLALKV